MGIISNDSIKIDGIDNVELRNLFVEVKPNEHGYAKLSLRIKENGKPENVIRSLDNKMVVISSSEPGNSGVLFKGYVAKCTINSRESSGIINIELVSTSIKLDEEKISKSYQKKEDTYKKVIGEAIEINKGINRFIDANISEKKINKPIIQYEETAWEFVKRIASRNRLQVVVDEIADKPTFTIGYEKRGSVPENRIIKSSIASFVKMDEYAKRRLNDEKKKVKSSDYQGIKFASFYNYGIGDSVLFRGKSYIVCAKTIKIENAQMIFVYEAGTDKLYGLEPICNEMLVGRCIEGKVEKTEKDYIKLNLDIDKEKKSENELYFFKWVPETSNIMYSMPEKDTVVSLYIGGYDEGDAIVINALRRDEDGIEYENNDNKYYTTSKGMRMVIAKDEIGFTGNSASKGNEHERNTGKAHVNIHDKDGLVIGTEKKIHIEAKECIEIKSGNKLTINGNKLLQIRKDKNALKMKREMAVTGSKAKFALGMGIPEVIEEAKKLVLKNTGKGVGDKELTEEQIKINEMFRGDQFKAEASFSRSIEPRLRSDMVQVNKNCTCLFEENLKEKEVENNDDYLKRFNDSEKKLYEELLYRRKNISPITDDTVMQKVIPKETVGGYIKNGWPTVQNCASKAEDAAPYVANTEDAYKNLRLDYAGSSYREQVENKEPVYVLRFKAKVDKDSDKKIKLPDCTNGNPPPCTGTGFIGADEELVPEVTLVDGGLPITSGAIYEINSEGNEYMAAYWDKDEKKFIEV